MSKNVTHPSAEPLPQATTHDHRQQIFKEISRDSQAKENIELFPKTRCPRTCRPGPAEYLHLIHYKYTTQQPPAPKANTFPRPHQNLSYRFTRRSHIPNTLVRPPITPILLSSHVKLQPLPSITSSSIFIHLTVLQHFTPLLQPSRYVIRIDTVQPSS
ncbi:hypothetical protein VTI74DRAFT_8752 [Chaetomium olivicolor]